MQIRPVSLFLLPDHRPVELRQASPRKAPLACHLSARHRHRGGEQGESEPKPVPSGASKVRPLSFLITPLIPCCVLGVQSYCIFTFNVRVCGS